MFGQADPGGQGVQEVAATVLNVPEKEVKDVTGNCCLLTVERELRNKLWSQLGSQGLPTLEGVTLSHGEMKDPGNDIAM